MNRIVLKIGGNQIDEPGFLAELAQVIAAMPEAPVLVHGGGKELSQTQMDLGVPFTVIGGLRVTSDATLRVAEMVLSGLINKRLVACLVNGGVKAVGLSGVDLGLIRVEKLHHPEGDLGWVGRPVEVNAAALAVLLDQGFMPVLSPISLGRDGHAYNVNADHAAAAVAVALNAAALVFVSNVPGVLVDGYIVERLSVGETEQLIKRGTISGGMVPKVRAALDAVAAGVNEARITDLAGLKAGTGTAFQRNSGELRGTQGNSKVVTHQVPPSSR